jgi:hypothetical protein
MRVCLGLLLVLASLTPAAEAQQRRADGLANNLAPQAEVVAGGVTLGEAQTTRMKFGMVISAGNAPCRGLMGSAPVPIDWAEQQVRIVEENVSPGVRITYRQLTPTVKEMLVSVPFLAAGATAEATVVVEMTRHSLNAPAETDGFVIPDRVSLDMRRNYMAASPGIEIIDREIRRQSAEAFRSTEGEPAWQRVEGLYKWVREVVEYKDGPLKGAAQALKDGNGDCEELSSLFIAACRINGIPARTVWVPGHCYPEFYLEDAEGNGHWFPCQAAGTYHFGEMPEFRPILQKGDNFRVPGESRPKRYVAERLTGAGGAPNVRFIRETVAAP